jgi:hypothetical protein
LLFRNVESFPQKHHGGATQEDLQRTEIKPRNSRIFPGWYALVMMQKGMTLIA